MLIELICCLGFMWGIKYGSILNKPRNFLSGRFQLMDQFLKCSLCIGFWSGVLIGCLSYFFVDKSPIYFYLPFASCAVCWFFDSLLDLIQIASNYLDKNG